VLPKYAPVKYKLPHLLSVVRRTGWLFKLEVKNVEELKALMDEKAYQKYLKEYDSDDEYQPI